MVRFLPIILGACVAIVSGLIGAVGVRALAHHEKVTAPALEVTLDQFVTKRPKDTFRYRLTNFVPGANVYPDPVAADGEWDTVYVCLFSKGTKLGGKNYTSVIAKIEGVKGSAELAELFKDGSLEAYYYSRYKRLPRGVYNRMAQRYRHMNFDRCIHCEAGGPPPSPEFGNSCILVGMYGVGISVVSVVVFYVFKLFKSLLFRTRDPWYDEEEEQVSNKAGLPTA